MNNTLKVLVASYDSDPIFKIIGINPVLSKSVIKMINSNNTEFIIKTLNIKEDNDLLEEY